MERFDLRSWSGFGAAGGNVSAPALVSQITLDSRRIDGSPALFVALPGKQVDGHRFVAQAATSGASFALVDRSWDPPASLTSIILLRVDNTLKAFQEIVQAYRKEK